MRSGYAAIDELAGSKLFGDYVAAFPGAARDAGTMLRVAVSVGLVDRYRDLLELALRERRPVLEEEWHALCALVSWPRALPAWDRAPIEQWRLDMNPDATPDWPEAHIGGCHFGFQNPDMAWPDPNLYPLKVIAVFVGIAAALVVVSILL